MTMFVWHPYLGRVGLLSQESLLGSDGESRGSQSNLGSSSIFDSRGSKSDLGSRGNGNTARSGQTESLLSGGQLDGLDSGSVSAAQSQWVQSEDLCGGTADGSEQSDQLKRSNGLVIATQTYSSITLNIVKAWLLLELHWTSVNRDESGSDLTEENVHNLYDLRLHWRPEGRELGRKKGRTIRCHICAIDDGMSRERPTKEPLGLRFRSNLFLIYSYSESIFCDHFIPIA